MIRSLRVENLAIIESLELEFAPGLNLLTGETGAGKSIIVDAIGLLLGGKASADSIRGGADVGMVEAEFGVEDGDTFVAEAIQRLDLELESGDTLTLRREVGEKRSRSFAQGRAMPVGALRDLAAGLLTIHGQHEHQALFDAASHLRLLDAFAAHQPLVEEVADWARRGRAAAESLRRYESQRAESDRRKDFLAYQIKEIASAALVQGEEEALRQERGRLLNAEKIRSLAESAAGKLYTADQSASEQIAVARRSMEELRRFIGGLDGELARVDEVAEILREASRVLDEIATRSEPDPRRIEAIEDRLYTIEKLKKKHGPDIPAVLRSLAGAEAELQALDRIEVDTREAEERSREARAAYGTAAGQLGESRREAAERLARAVRKQLAELAMQSTRFEVRFEAAAEPELNECGCETAEFYISANPGEPMRPLAMAASGGELSRIMLALRNTSNDRRSARTLIFDEIDAGIGGTVAEIVGRKLHSVSRRQQVLCVTHLPQIAAFADRHVAVDKLVRQGRTITRVRALEAPERLHELARMMGSAEPSAAALRHAREILDRAAE